MKQKSKKTTARHESQNKTDGKEQEKPATRKNDNKKQFKSSIQEDLISIYKNEGDLPDMSKLEKIKSHRQTDIT